MHASTSQMLFARRIPLLGLDIRSSQLSSQMIYICDMQSKCMYIITGYSENINRSLYFHSFYTGFPIKYAQFLKYLKFIFSIILPSLSSLGRLEIFFNFEKRTTFLGNPVVFRTDNPYAYKMLCVCTLAYRLRRLLINQWT